VPDTAVIISMREGGIRHPHDLVDLALEDRNARDRAAIRWSRGAALTSSIAGCCELRPSQRFKLLFYLLAPGFVARPELVPDRDACIGQHPDGSPFDKVPDDAPLRGVVVRNERIGHERREGDALGDSYLQHRREFFGLIRGRGLFQLVLQLSEQPVIRVFT
jgi:hypothetical protein